MSFFAFNLNLGFYSMLLAFSYRSIIGVLNICMYFQFSLIESYQFVPLFVLGWISFFSYCYIKLDIILCTMLMISILCWMKAFFLMQSIRGRIKLVSKISVPSLCSKPGLGSIKVNCDVAAGESFVNVALSEFNSVFL